MTSMDEALRKAIMNAKPMTPEQRFEQRVSWVFGQIGGPLTKDDVRNILRKQMGASPVVKVSA